MKTSNFPSDSPVTTIVTKILTSVEIKSCFNCNTQIINVGGLGLETALWYDFPIVYTDWELFSLYLYMNLNGLSNYV